MFTAAIIGRLHTGVVVRYNLQRKVVMDGRTVARMYLFHGSMIFDIASALPSWIEVRWVYRTVVLQCFLHNDTYCCFCTSPRQRVDCLIDLTRVFDFVTHDQHCLP